MMDETTIGERLDRVAGVCEALSDVPATQRGLSWAAEASGTLRNAADAIDLALGRIAALEASNASMAMALSPFDRVTSAYDYHGSEAMPPLRFPHEGKPADDTTTVLTEANFRDATRALTERCVLVPFHEELPYAWITTNGATEVTFDPSQRSVWDLEYRSSMPVFRSPRRAVAKTLGVTEVPDDVPTLQAALAATRRELDERNRRVALHENGRPVRAFEGRLDVGLPTGVYFGDYATKAAAIAALVSAGHVAGFLQDVADETFLDVSEECVSLLYDPRPRPTA